MKKYCIHCQQEVELNIKEEKVTAVVRGKSVTYLSKSAMCPVCSKELYVPEINDGNLDRLDAAYKKQEDIISIEEINDILEMYHIGKRPLSCLLGFGEITVTRFLDGKIPSKKSSDILKEVLNSTEKMRGYIEKNTDDSLKNACKNVMDSIEEIEQIKNASKLEQASQYILINLEDPTNMVLNKLLHFAQVLSFMVDGEALFSCESQAWRHGPVYPDIYHKYKKYKKDVISPVIKNDKLLDLNQRDRDILDKIIICFGCYSAATLRNISHVENVWRDLRSGLSDDDPSAEVIKLSAVKEYAKELKERLDIDSIEDAKKYSAHLRYCDFARISSLL